MQEDQRAPLEALKDIRSMMEQSVRFISLSGWSGIWAGTVALLGSFIANNWLQYVSPGVAGHYDLLYRFILLAMGVFIVALIGGYYFTWKKTRALGTRLWNSASRRMVTQMAIPLAAGGVFALHFLFKDNAQYIAPACLAFYGLALINGSKYTLSDIQYLGVLEVILGCICLFMPGYGLLFWAIGFGVLHILYGIFMWNKYDNRMGKEDR